MPELSKKSGFVGNCGQVNVSSFSISCKEKILLPIRCQIPPIALSFCSDDTV